VILGQKFVKVAELLDTEWKELLDAQIVAGLLDMDWMKLLDTRMKLLAGRLCSHVKLEREPDFDVGLEQNLWWQVGQRWEAFDRILCVKKRP
jgi:hypothetical protein